MAPRFVCSVVLALLVSGCSGGSDNPTQPVAAPTITALNSALTLPGIGSSQTISATVAPATATVSWSSQQSNIASVSGAGPSVTITAVSAGTTTVTGTATNGNRTATVQISVTVVPVVKSVVFAPPTLFMVAGTTQLLTPSVVADAGASTALTWSSSESSVATVSPDGTVTAIAPGTSTIRATSVATTAVSGTLHLTVTAAPRVHSIVISPALDTLVAGQQRQFLGTVTADAPLSTAVTWQSSAIAVATVNASGMVVSVAPGNTVITARSQADNSVFATAPVHVRTPEVRQVTMTLAPTVVAGLTVQATVQVVADAGASQALTWTSSQPSIATVDANGLVIGVSAGSADITVRSVAFPLIASTRTITVSMPPTTSVWNRTNVGVGGAVSSLGVHHLMIDAAGNGFAAIDASVGNVVAAAGAMERTGATFALRTTGAFEDRQVTDGAGTSPSDYFVSLLGNPVWGSIPQATTPVVLRWNGATFQDTNWPTPSGTTSSAAFGISSVAPGHILAHSLDGAVWRYNTGTWTQLTPTLATFVGRSIAAWTADSAVVGLCRAQNVSASRIGIFRNGTLTPIPNVAMGDGAFPASACAGELLARPGGEFFVVFETAIGRYASGNWTAYTTTLDQDEQFTSLGECAGSVFAGTSAGHVFRIEHPNLVAVDNGLAATGPVFELHCGGDGALRVGSRSGLITRRVGESWVDEHFSPDVQAVHLASGTRGAAVGGSGLVYRWDGNAFTRVRRSRITQTLHAVWVAPDGAIFAAGDSYTAAGGATGAHLLHSNGADFVSTHNPGFTNGTAIWGSSATNVFAVVRNHPWIATTGKIMRWNGSVWSTAFEGADSPIALHGIAATDAFATGANGAVWRWNGTAWSPQASIPGAADQSLNQLLMVSPTLAFAGNDCIAGEAGGSWRWNGAAWVDAGIGAAGFPPCVRALFGTGATDIFAVVGTNLNTVLIRWNGTSWSLQAGAEVPNTTGGAGVPGLSIVTGSRGGITIGRPAAAARVRR